MYFRKITPASNPSSGVASAGLPVNLCYPFHKQYFEKIILSVHTITTHFVYLLGEAGGICMTRGVGPLRSRVYHTSASRASLTVTTHHHRTVTTARSQHITTTHLPSGSRSSEWQYL